MHYENRTFTDSDVQLDGHRFDNCTFRNCRLIYAGGEVPILQRNFLDEGCVWALTDAAALTINFMTALYHGVESGRDILERTFEKIRRGEHPYYPRVLTGRFIQSTERYPFMGMAHDDDGNPVDVVEAVFPIFEHQGESSPWLLLGTGFFITEYGIFATAKHVVFNEEIGEVRKSLWAIQMIRRSGSMVLRPLTQVKVHPVSDVAVGLLEDVRFTETGTRSIDGHLILSHNVPAIGERVVTLAYPRPRIVIDDPRNFRVRYYPAGLAGEVVAYYPEGRDRTLLPGPCFETSIDLRGHASGGPVGYGRGAVFAINSTGLNEERGPGAPPPVSYVSSVQDLYSLRLREFWTSDGSHWSDISLAEMEEQGILRSAERPLHPSP